MKHYVCPAAILLVGGCASIDQSNTGQPRDLGNNCSGMPVFEVSATPVSLDWTNMGADSGGGQVTWLLFQSWRYDPIEFQETLCSGGSFAGVAEADFTSMAPVSGRTEFLMEGPPHSVYGSIPTPWPGMAATMQLTDDHLDAQFEFGVVVTESGVDHITIR